ncbi:uncharacterized protein LOC113146663, partial [Cyclospora cayetanensis]|uniref:Uncharacterized protein LOC113146663 n=1 Tax=Cyclospora cayetanensis TaxID=88456 RepID=A0A6P6RRQ1_9EIME
MCDPIKHSAWITLPPMLQQRQQLAAVAVGNMLVAMGGRDSTGNKGLVLKTCERLVLPLSQKSEGVLGEQAAWLAAESKKNAATPVSPNSTSGDSPSGVCTAEEEEDAVKGLTPTETPRHEAARVSSGEFLSTFCSRQQRPSLKGPVLPWVALPPMRQARCRFAAAHIRGKIFCVGGLGGVKALASVEVFDAMNNTWIEGPPLNIPRIGASLLLWFTARGTPLLLALGGQSAVDEAEGPPSRGGPLRSAETLDLKAYFFAAFGELLPPLQPSLQQAESLPQPETPQGQHGWMLHEDCGLANLSMASCAVDCTEWTVCTAGRFCMRFAATQKWASELPGEIAGTGRGAAGKPKATLAASGRRNVPQSLSLSGCCSHGLSPQTSEELRRLLPKGRVAAASR